MQAGSVYGDNGDDVISITKAEVLENYSIQFNQKVPEINITNVSGGEGSDKISIGSGIANVDGGNGNDVITMDIGEVSHLVRPFVSQPIDKVVVQASKLDGGDGNDIITLNKGTARITGGDGNDVITINEAKTDIYDSPYNPYGEKIVTNTNVSGGKGDDRIIIKSGEANVYAGEDNDFVEIGGSGNNTVWAAEGNDTVNTGSGNDNINGGSGNDLINGGAGNDTIDGGTGNNTLTGGLGADRFVISNVKGEKTNDIITDFSSAQGDKIDFNNTSMKNFADVASHTYQFGNSAVIASDDVRAELQNVQSSSLTANDFLF